MLFLFFVELKHSSKADPATKTNSTNCNLVFVNLIFLTVVINMLHSFSEILLLSWTFSLWAFSVIDRKHDAIPVDSIPIAFRQVLFGRQHRSSTSMCKDKTCIFFLFHIFGSDNPNFNRNSILDFQIQTLFITLLLISVPSFPLCHLVCDGS